MAAIAADESLCEGADAFVVELERLLREVRQLGQQLDRIEEQVRGAVNDAARELFEEYR
jgi:hypothetical protein